MGAWGKVRVFLVVGPRGVRAYETLEGALQGSSPDDYIITCVQGRPVVLRLTPLKAGTEEARLSEPTVPEEDTTEGQSTVVGQDTPQTIHTILVPHTIPVSGDFGGYRVAAVFDQMFRGFADTVARHVEGVELHEIVGRGLDMPMRRGRITMWPAQDDFDVLQVVRTLAAQGKKVVFFTGDKKLARQAESLSDPMIRVEYMPPNEYPGKESLANAMIRALKEEVERAG